MREKNTHLDMQARSISNAHHRSAVFDVNYETHNAKVLRGSVGVICRRTGWYLPMRCFRCKTSFDALVLCVVVDGVRRVQGYDRDDTKVSHMD